MKINFDWKLNHLMFYPNLYLIMVVVVLIIIFLFCVFLCFLPLSNIHVFRVCINSTLQIRSYWEQLCTWEMLQQYIMRQEITIMFFIFVMLPVTFLCSCNRCRNTTLDCIWLLSPHALCSLTKYCLTIKPILMRKMKKSGAHKATRKKVRRNLKKLSTTLTTYSPRNGKRKAATLTRLVIQINLLAHLRKK